MDEIEIVHRIGKLVEEKILGDLMPLKSTFSTATPHGPLADMA